MLKNNKFEILDVFKAKPLIAELPLCTVVMEDKEFPWVLLIPRRKNVLQINQLPARSQLQLMREINAVSNIMEKLFPCDRLNVAAIGNKCPQLHLHIICRTKNDSLWPETVWGKEMQKLTDEELKSRLEKIRHAFTESVFD